MRNFFYLLVLVAIISSCSKTNVYQWRGTGRMGVYNESKLLKIWPETGPQLLWATEEIGNGYVSPTITEDAMFITGEVDSLAYLFKFDFKGSLLWKVAYDKEWVKSYPGSRSNPTVVGDLIYVGSGNGNLFCISAVDGKIKWSKKFDEDFQGEFPLFGHSEAPLVDDNLVFWTPGGSKYNVVALNRFTGGLVWSNECFKERSAYNNPVIINLPQRKILVTFSAYYLLGLDAKTGTLLWSQEQTSFPVDKRGPGAGDTHANSVWFENGFLYCIEGDGNCGVKLQLSDDGTQIKEIWRNKDFDSYMGGFIKVGNKLFCGSTAKPRFVCADATTGALTDSLKIGTGSIISADNMLYYYSYKGQVHLIDYSNNAVRSVSSFKVSKGTKEHFAHPVIRNGVLYVRHGKAFMAYDIRKKD